MSDGATHYETLGLTPEATAEDVKRRFRELARQHHPDLNPGKPEIHALFVRINQAHETLSDPDARAAYDLHLRDRARRLAEQRAAAAAGHGAAWAGNAGGASRGTGSAPPGGHAAGARAASGGRPAGAGAVRDPGAQRELEERRRRAMRLMDAARVAYSRGNLREANRLARESLQAVRSGSAHEMLGDIYARHQRLDKAIEHYTVAAQLSPQPAAGRIISKLESVSRRQAVRARAQPGRPAPGRAPGPSRAATPAQQALAQFQRLAHRGAVTAVGAGLVTSLVARWEYLGARPIQGNWPVVEQLPAGLLLAMAASGFTTGMALAAAGWVRRFADEMVVFAGEPPRVLPLGLVMALFGMVFMPMAFAAYVGIAYYQGLFSGSIAAVFGLAATLAATFAAAAPVDAYWHALLAGGNLIFVTMLAGWYLGELFRPAWSG